MPAWIRPGRDGWTSAAVKVNYWDWRVNISFAHTDAIRLPVCTGRALHSRHANNLSPVTLPYEDNSMDFVTSVCVYHHVHGRDRTLLTREIRRVLVPGGLYCIVEHNPWNPVTRTIVGRCAVDVDAELLAASNASQLLNAGGFELLRTSYFLYLPEKLFGHFGAMERPLEHVPLGRQCALLGRAPV